MTIIKNWRNLVGIIEILVGSILMLPVILTFVLAIILKLYGESSVFSKLVHIMPEFFGLTIHNHHYGIAEASTGGFFILTCFFCIGVIILINGVLKTRTN